MGRYKDALDAYRADLGMTLFANFDAKAEIQALLKPFFPDGWDGHPVPLRETDLSCLLNDAALTLSNDDPEQGRELLGQNVALCMKQSAGASLATVLSNLGAAAHSTNRLAEAIRLKLLSEDIGEAMADADRRFTSKVNLLFFSMVIGDEDNADRLWRELERVTPPTIRAIYRPGDAESFRALHLFYRGQLTEQALAHAETLARLCLRPTRRVAVVAPAGGS